MGLKEHPAIDPQCSSGTRTHPAPAAAVLLIVQRDNRYLLWRTEDVQCAPGASGPTANCSHKGSSTALIPSSFYIRSDLISSPAQGQQIRLSSMSLPPIPIPSIRHLMLKTNQTTSMTTDKNIQPISPRLVISGIPYINARQKSLVSLDQILAGELIFRAGNGQSNPRQVRFFPGRNPG